MSSQRRSRFAAVCSGCGEQLTTTYTTRDEARLKAYAHVAHDCSDGGQLAVEDVRGGEAGE